MEERYVTVKFCGLFLESQLFILRRIQVGCLLFTFVSILRLDFCT